MLKIQDPGNRATSSNSSSKRELVPAVTPDMGNVHVFVSESGHSSWTKWRTWKSTRSRASRKFIFYAISHRNRYWSILKRF